MWIVACFAVAILIAPHILDSVRHSLAMVTFPWQVDFDEGVVLHSAYLISEGLNPYPGLKPSEFVSGTYPPLYYLLLAPWYRWVGLDMSFGRAVSLAATLMASLAIAWLVGRHGGGLLGAFAAGALFLGNGIVGVWGSFQKPDMLALALEVAGLALFAMGKGLWHHVAIVAFVLAFFTKQSALAGVAAVALYLLWESRARAFRWLALVAGSVLVGVVMLEAMTGGYYLLHVAAFQAAIPWRWTQLENQLNKLVANNGWLVVCGGVAWLLSWRERRLMLLSLYGFSALLTTLAINGRAGVNYGLLLAGLPALVIFSTVMPRVLLASQGWWKAWGAVLGLGMVLAAGTSSGLEHWYSMGRMPEVVHADQYAKMVRLVAEQPGPALSENSQVLLLAGKKVIFDDTFLMAWAARSGLWDDSELVRMLKDRQFGVLLFEKEPSRLSPEAQRAVWEGYYLAYRDYLNIWLPRKE